MYRQSLQVKVCWAFCCIWPVWDCWAGVGRLRERSGVGAVGALGVGWGSGEELPKGWMPKAMLLPLFNLAISSSAFFNNVCEWVNTSVLYICCCFASSSLCSRIQPEGWCKGWALMVSLPSGWNCLVFRASTLSLSLWISLFCLLSLLT